MPLYKILRDRAVVARWAHYPEVVGSNPTPATKLERQIKNTVRWWGN